jgi:O-antigen ligase
VGSRWWNLLVASACLITLSMTGSRFGLLTVSVGILFLFLLISSSRRRGLARIAFLLLLIPVFAWTYETVATSNRRTLERYQTLRDPLKIDSLRQRLDDVWQDEWRDFTQSPFVGHGPAKSFYTQGFADSEYLGVLREKGLMGMVVFLGYYLYPLFLIQKGERAARHFGGSLEEQAPATVLSVHFGLIVVVLALIMNLGMSTFYSPFLQGFLWLWLGVGARSSVTARALVYSPAIVVNGRQKLSKPREAAQF